MKNNSTQSHKTYTKPQVNRVYVDYLSWWQRFVGKSVFGGDMVDDSESMINPPTQEDIKISTIINTLNFETKLFKGFVVPGIIAEVVLVLNLFLPDSISLYGAPLLKFHISGPMGWVVGMTTLPVVILFGLFLLVAAVYAIVLAVMSHRRSQKLVATTRGFLVFCDTTFVLLSVTMTFFFVVALVEGYLNLPIAIPVYLTLCAALVYFIHWTRKVYRHEGLRFWSKTTLKSIGTAVGFLLLGIVAVQALLFL